MKTEKSILVAFILNLVFSVFEFIGGTITGSVAIMSDAIHDIGDAASIGTSYLLEKKSKRRPDGSYTYGYARYSVMGSVITTLILLGGSVAVIYNAITRILSPVDINYKGMILFALVGVLVNLISAIVTRDGDSLNQKSVNLHMLEDVLGWVVVLVGAVIMNFTNIRIIDPILSIAVSVFILINAVKNLRESLEVFLERAPHDIDAEKLSRHIMKIDKISSVHHIHLWTMDGYNNFATMHVVTEDHSHSMKEAIREALRDIGIAHVTLELEYPDEDCHEEHCHIYAVNPHRHCHHH